MRGNTQLADLSEDIRYGMTASAQESGSHRLIRITDITDLGELKADGAKFVSPTLEESNKYSVEGGDLLIARSGSVGRAYLAGQKSESVFASYLIRFRLREDLVLPKYVFYFAQTRHYRKLVASTGRGGAIKNINAKQLGSLEIPLQPISRQVQIVARIEDCFNRVKEATDLVSAIPEDLVTLKHSLLFGDSQKELRWEKASDLVTWVQDSEKVLPQTTYDFAGVRSFGRGAFASVTKTSNDFKYPKLRRVKAKDFIYPKLMAWEGAFGIVSESLAGRVVSPEFMVFRAKEDRLLPEVLDTYFRSPFCLEDVRASSTGSNQRRRRLNPKAFLELKVPVPPMERQIALREVCRIEAQVLEERKNRAEELGALRDSILHKAFAGEL